MYINCFNNNGFPYLRLVESQRYTADDGTKKVRKKTILNIGPVSKFDDGKPDYVERLKISFQNGDPLIPILKPYCSTTPKRNLIRFEVDLDDEETFNPSTKVISHLIIENFLKELGLISIFQKYKNQTRIQFDITGIFRLLIYTRLLKPCSKIESMRYNDSFITPIVKDLYEYNVYDTLDFIHNFRDKIIKKINSTLIKKQNRQTDIVYYDVTNFFTEIDNADVDETDEEGNVIKGIRKHGFSKENRKTPIVQMGLFMDSNGIPISIEMFPGNTLDHLTVIPSIEKTAPNLGINKFIFIGDRGMYQGPNMSYLLENNNGYIVSKSIQKTSSKEKDWIYDKSDYIHISSTFKYKERIINRTVKNHTGNKATYREKVVVYWSKKYYDKQIKDNQSFLELIKKVQESPQNFKMTKSQNDKLKKFFKKEVVNTKTGEVINSNDIKFMIDYDKVNKFVESFGYYQIVTSEIEKDSLEIINLYKGLNEIEQQFRTLKSEIEARPFYVRTKEHIDAHFLICTISLIITRLIQIKISKLNNNDEKVNKNFDIGMSLYRIRNAFNELVAAKFHGDYYRIYNTDNEDIQTILTALDINIPTKPYKLNEIKKIKDNFKIF